MVSAATIAAACLLILYCAVWSLCVIGCYTARHRYEPNLPLSRLTKISSKSIPGVTIIRPLCGLDTNLYNALETAMNLNYPKFEILFVVQNPHDEAIPVTQMLLTKYPSVEARIIIENRNIGVNPKVNNLLPAFEQARYDLLWVIDATISVNAGSLGRSVETFLGLSSDVESAHTMADEIRPPPIKGDVGLVHHVPVATAKQRTWGSLVEQAFLNTTHAKMYLAINALGIDSCVMGKSNLYSKSNIASLTSPSPTLRSLPNPPTGLAGFSPFLAEDNMIGLSLWHELSLKHAMTGDVAVDCLGALSLKDYIQRRMRWIRVRKRMTPPLVVALEPFTESLLSGYSGAWALNHFFGFSRALWFCLHMVIWLFLDLGVCWRLSAVGRVETATPLAWLLREVLALPIWIYGVCGSTVKWRGRKYQILRSGEAREVH